MALSEDEELELLELEEEEEYQNFLKQQTNLPKEPSVLQQAGEFAGDVGIALGQGATRGWAEEGSAALEKWMGSSPLFSKAAEKLNLIDNAAATQELYKDKSYNELLAVNRDRLDLAKKRLGDDYSKAQFIGEIPGYAATFKAAPALAGALEGGVSALGQTESDKLSSDALLETAGKATLGGILGYGAGKVIEKGVIPATKTIAPKIGEFIKPAVESAKEKFDDIASTQIARALGGTKKQLTNIGESRIKKAGDIMRQEGIDGLKTSETLAKRVNERLKEVGQELGNTVDNVAKELSENAPESIIDDSVTQIAENFRNSPVYQKLYSAGARDFDDIAMMEFNKKLSQLERLAAEPGAGFKSLQNFKQVLGDEIKDWRKLLPGDPRRGKNLQDGLKTLYKEVNDQLNELASFTPSGSKYSQLNRTYSGLSDANQLAFKEATEAELSGDIGTQIVNALADKIPLAGKALTRPETALGGSAFALAKMAGMSTPMSAAIAVPTTLGAYGVKKLGRQGVSKGADIMVRLLNENPAALGKFSTALGSAAARGPSSINATIYMLSQQYPEFREMLNKFEEESKTEE